MAYSPLRLIGYAIIRQIRQDYGHCKPPKMIRKAFYTCEGDHHIGTEDQKDYCVGWEIKVFSYTKYVFTVFY